MSAKGIFCRMKLLNLYKKRLPEAVSFFRVGKWLVVKTIYGQQISEYLLLTGGCSAPFGAERMKKG